ncbi:MAG: hypothetical protein R3260_00755 [Pseudomonas sp.]|nr:hypothetical protein [Pseudomonas sp.]
MSAILEAARLQGGASITRKAWASRGKQKVHLWELSTGGVILLRHAEGEGFKQPVKLEEPLELIVDRFREKRGHRVFAP